MNENGEKLAEFCALDDLVIGGTLFKHRDIHKLTLTLPQGSKLTVVWLSWTTKITISPWVTQSVVVLVLNEDLIDLNKYNSLLSLESKRYLN